MRNEALELALALYRAPIQRFALRGRPLPRDIGVVIQLASGIQPFLSEAAALRDESEETILEASRFYLQQVLFETDADAYRVLGVAPVTPPERIREHYHWLQRWLHPDRRGEDWEGLLATRVNWAWQNLRNESARSAYDSEREKSTPATASESHAFTSMPTGEWKAIPLTQPSRSWSKRIALALSFGTCLGLLFLALTRHDSMPSEDSTSLNANEGVVVTPAAPVESPPVAPALQPTDAGPISAVVSEPVPQAAALSPDTGQSIQVAAPIPESPAVVVATPQTSIAALPTEALHTLPMAAIQKPATAAEAPAPAHSVVASNLSQSSENHQSGVDTGGREKIASAAPQQTDAPAALRHLSGETPNKPETVTKTIPAAKPVAPALNAVTETAPNIPQAGKAAEPAAYSEPPAEHIAAQQPAPDAGAASAESFARIDLARQRIQEVATYFGRFKTLPPPVWNDVSGQIGAERARDALHDRTQLHTTGDFEIDMPVWRMSEVTAALNANYRLRKGRSVSESGHLSVDMIWREKMWLVTRVALEPGP